MLAELLRGQAATLSPSKVCFVCAALLKLVRCSRMSLLTVADWSGHAKAAKRGYMLPRRQ